MKFMQHSILLLLLSSSCLADSSQQSVAAEQPVADGLTENAAKNGATTVDKSQNKRGAPDIPVIIGAPAQHTAYYNYASAVPQLTYAHYPQYQLYHNQHQQQQQQQGTGQLTHDYHPVATATVHELPQQQAAYAHQQPIYAHHPATTIHYSAIPLVSGQPNYQGQHHQHQQQQQHQYPLTHTQAIHYQPAAGGQPSVPIVHQAPIATINQVHQAHQLYAAQGQLAKYPLSAHSVYGAGGGVPAVQNQIYSTAPSYGDPDTLTNLANPQAPSTPQYLPRPRPTVGRPYTGDIRPIAEYEDDEEGDDDGGTENDLYRDEPQPTDRPDLSFDPEEPCEKDLQTGRGPGSFNRNLYNMWRAYGVARTLLQASSAGSTPPRAKGRPPAKDGSTDRIHLIHPPGESDKKLKGKYYRGKYYGTDYSRQGRRDEQRDSAGAQGNRRPKSLQTGPPPSSASPSSSPSAGSTDQELGPTYYQQQQRPAASGSAVAGQILPATVATPAHLKPFVPVTTATTTHHHGNGISYSTFTQPGSGAAFQGQTKAQSVLQTQPVYYNTLQQPATYFRQPVAVPAQQQQPRVQVFSTVATPTVQKTAGPVFAGNQFSHPVPPYPAYAFGHQAHQGAAGLISGAGPTLYHQQHQQHQQSAAASAGKLAYLPSPVNVGGLVAGGGRGSIYLLH
ncbi:uncharacterized protein LOC131207200 [Anopheles bellator]|uniref:uncharacterized protein LOC131207200 n=1 Tax=Anopheles bellator TaxID=139047 RepID=UPI002648A903|nr:uncharacterized protein LOC131207200 [Anopheles bellator]